MQSLLRAEFFLFLLLFCLNSFGISPFSSGSENSWPDTEHADSLETLPHFITHVQPTAQNAQTHAILVQPMPATLASNPPAPPLWKKQLTVAIIVFESILGLSFGYVVSALFLCWNEGHWCGNKCEKHTGNCRPCHPICLNSNMGVQFTLIWAIMAPIAILMIGTTAAAAIRIQES